MIKNKILIICVFAGLALSALAIIFFLKTKKLDANLIRTEQLVQKMHGDMLGLQQEKERVIKENEAIQADAVSYLSLNTALQSEKEKLQKQLQTAQKSIKAKQNELKAQTQKLNQLQKERARRKDELSSDNAEVKSKIQAIKALEETLAGERALYHYNLAVAYTTAKLYAEAIDAYETALKFDPNNADAHYNLGLLYSNIKDDPLKAEEHYKKYLELNPDADDVPK